VTPSASLYQLDASLAVSGIERGILVTTGRLSEEASDLPEAKSIQVIDSKELGRLLETHLGVSARFGRKNKL
jgi:restriction endonuclease Mrr